MSARIIQFPTHRAAAVFVMQAVEGGWILLGPRGQGWLHGDLPSAFADAESLSKNLSLPVRSYDQ